jgi:Hemerythrin HHE cation binding domain
MRLGAGLLIGITAGGYLLLRRRRSAARREGAPPQPALMPEAIPTSQDPDDVFAVLRAEHDEIKAMGAAWREPEESREPQDSWEDESAAAVARLVARCSQHEAVEELHFWPAVRDRLEDGDQLADRGQAEEVELRRTLHSLERRGPDSPDYEPLLHTLLSAAYDHFVFEEVHVWPPLSRSMDREARSELGARLLQARGDAPTHPHISAMAMPGRHRRLGRAIGWLDRFEDRRGHRAP